MAYLLSVAVPKFTAVDFRIIVVKSAILVHHENRKCESRRSHLHAIFTYMSTLKSILIPAITLAAGLAGGYWWADSKCGGSGKPHPTDSSEYVCNSKTIVPEDALMTVDTAFAMIARYGANLPPDSAHTRSVWFSTERIHALLCVMQRDKMSGVRFYLANYADEYLLPKEAGTIGHIPIKPYWGHTTFVMVTTREEKKKHIDHIQVNPDHRPTKGMILTGFPDEDDPENNGEMCPPPKNCFNRGALMLAPNVDSTKKYIYK